MNNRRKLVLAIGAGALTAPLRSFAQQQGKVWRIGFLWETEQSYYARRFEAFKTGMRALGYTEGRDYAFEQRSAENNLARLPALLAELIAMKADVIISSGTPSALAAKDATREISILITTVSDPIGSGLAASLSRPGGNVTGFTQGVGTELYTKRLDLLRQILTRMSRAGFLYNPENAADAQSLRQFESDCAKLGFKPVRAPVRKREDIPAAFEVLKRDKAQGIVVTNVGTNFAWKDYIIEQAAKHRLPALYATSPYADAGGLISYGPDTADLYRRAAAYADKIFKGARPGDLPIQQPITFDLVVNIKTAKALGVTFPKEIMVLATSVIQ